MPRICNSSFEKPEYSNIDCSKSDYNGCSGKWRWQRW